MDVQRESMDVDVLIVGGGPAGLATAIYLTRLISTAREDGTLKGAAANEELLIMVVEKGAEFGDHSLSGAVLDPKGLDELYPDWRDRDVPLATKVNKDALFFLTPKGKIKAPFLPAAMNNHGCYIVSLQQMVKWLGAQSEEAGVMCFTGTAGAEPIFRDGRLTGVITDDKGVDKNGNPKSNFEPGLELNAKITVLAEGPRGSLTKQVVKELALDKGCNPQGYVTGVKELWEIPKGRLKAGTVYHTVGFPLDFDTFGGGFIYAMSDELLAIGLVTTLAYKDPRTDPHGNFQQMKTHPWIASLLKGGKMVRYGAKTISEGGWFAMPRLYADGLLLVGESGGFLDAFRLKGIHLAFKAGMMAAETAFEALSNEDYSAKTLKAYQDRFDKSWAKQELWKVRNFHQGFESGLIAGGIHTVAQLATGGRGFTARLEAIPNHEHIARLSAMPQARQSMERKFDGELTFDKLSDVYASGTIHEEHQPAHLHIADTSICEGQCLQEYGNPCQYFCPAQVYEMVEDDAGVKRLRLNPSNCVHCKTCDIADPFQNITWVPPEGGGGPKYVNL